MHLLVAAHDLYPDPGSGGSGRYVYETGKRLVERGHDVSVVTRRRGDVPERGTVEGMRVARYDFSVAETPAPRIAAQLPRVVRNVRGHLDALPDPDALSVQAPVTGPLLDLLVGDDVPRSCTFHSPWSTEYEIRTRDGSDLSAPRRRANVALRRAVERDVIRDCDRVLALSEFMRRTLREVYGPVADPDVVPGGVDATRFRPDAGSYEPMTSDGESEELAFLTVRRLSPRMGHELLLKSYARVARDRPRTHLYVAGDGPLRDDLERRAADLGIADRVTFLGYVPDADLPSAYASADCFVLPTTELEGFGLATLEALASGLPVVATPVGGTPELLAALEQWAAIPERLLAESAEESALADRLAAWADLSAAERRRAGRACRDYVREKFTWESTVDALERRYEALGA